MEQQYQQQPEDQQMMEQAPQEQQAIGGPSYEEIMAAQKITFEDVKRHLTGPVISFIAHVVIISLLCSLMVYNDKPETKEVQVTVMDIDTREVEKLPEPPPPPQDPPPNDNSEPSVDVERPSSNAVTTDVNVTVASEATGQIGDPSVDAPAVQMANVLMVAPSSSSLIMPGLMAGRGAPGRRTALGKYNRGGNSSGIERSTTKGLNWLRDHQNADGSWGETPMRIPAMTALATLAFLAHGETPSSQEYGSCVLKAIKKLVEFANTANADGLIANSGNGYGHAMVAYALSEAFALTKIPIIEDAMNKTIGKIVNSQTALGSYNYGYNKGGNSDLSVAGWNYQALKAAFAAGCTVSGLETAIENAKTTGLKKAHYVSGGGFSYGGTATGGGGPTPTMTSVGTLCLQLFGEGKSKEALDGLKWIETTQNGALMKCDWKASCRGAELYQWYYQTQALFQGYSGTGGAWDAWNKEFQKALLREQESDGHWTSPNDKYGDKKNIEGAAGHLGSKTSLDLHVYSTSLCTLMLEVYYRYLPTFKVSSSDVGGGGAPAAKKDAGKDELKIE